MSSGGIFLLSKPVARVANAASLEESGASIEKLPVPQSLIFFSRIFLAR